MLTILDSPNNFPSSHRAPQVGDIVTLYFKESNIVAQNGIAIEIDEVFLRWICRVDILTILPLLINNLALGGVI